jgi:quercetin dioxygenase-like cupin family protein
MSQHIAKIGDGLNVKPLLWALRRNPQLWNEHRARTQAADSPHREVDDIWVRYAAPDLVSDQMSPHESVWYPSAALLPVAPLCKAIMARVGGERLGGVLITQIPPGHTCHPHSDHGWHARYYEKFAVQVESGPGQAFCFDGERLETQPGDLFWFDNSATHWVENPTPYNRITMIVCIKPMHIP